MTPDDLKIFMLAHDLRQKDAAEALGVSPRHLRRMLCGERTITKTIQRLVYALNDLALGNQQAGQGYTGDRGSSPSTHHEPPLK